MSFGLRAGACPEALRGVPPCAPHSITRWVRWIGVVLVHVLPLVVSAQLLPATALDSVRTFHSLESALKQPDMVFRLDLSHQKIKDLPEEIRRFKNLNALDLGRNKLRTLPDWLGELQYLQELRVSRNKLAEFPAIICRLTQLKRLDLSRNAITGLPECLGGLDQLVSLDLWSNDLAVFPPDLEGMKALRFLDLRVIQFSPEEMERIKELLPWAAIYFSQPCNCGETP